MKKILAIVLAIVFSMAFTVQAMAVQEPTLVVRIYDFAGNLVENPDLDNLWKYGAVFNADGTIAYTYEKNGVEYVNATKTLAAGKYWQSYQYYVEQGRWLVGTGTCNQSGVKVETYYSTTVGGSREYWSIYDTELTSVEDGTNFIFTSESGYINYIYRNTASATRTFNVHIYIN